MTKRNLTHGLFLLLFSFFTIGIHGQSIKKLNKNLQKSDFEKLITLSQKRIKKGMRDSTSYYYLTWGYLIKAQQTEGVASERSFYQASRQYESFNSVVQVKGSESDLDEEFHTTGLQVYSQLSAKKRHRRKYYAVFFATHFGDTVADYDDLFAKQVEIKPEQAVENEEINNSIVETTAKHKQGIKYSIPKKIPAGNVLIKSAETVIGTPWVWAGTKPDNGFDCSGFVVWAYGEFGYDLPHRTKLLAKIGKPVAKHEVQESDLVCFGSKEYNPQSVWHIGMVHSVNGNHVQVIHCATSIGVSVAPLHEGYWSEVECFFVRIQE